MISPASQLVEGVYPPMAGSPRRSPVWVDATQPTNFKTFSANCRAKNAKCKVSVQDSKFNIQDSKIERGAQETRAQIGSYKLLTAQLDMLNGLDLRMAVFHFFSRPAVDLCLFYKRTQRARNTGVTDLTGVTGGCFLIFFIASVLRIVHIIIFISHIWWSYPIHHKITTRVNGSRFKIQDSRLKIRAQSLNAQEFNRVKDIQGCVFKAQNLKLCIL